MSETLVFMMGKFEARIPCDRLYSENHLWLQATDGRQDAFRVGLTAYSVRLLQDVYFLEWSIDPDTTVRSRQTIGEIESSKALSSLYAPADGQVGRFNEVVLADPSAINVDGYGSGWLYEFSSTAVLLDPESYLRHLERGWEKDQQYLKGQVNR